MKNLILTALVLFVAMMCTVRCSSAPARTKYADPTHRIMVDPDSIDAKNYVRLQQALVDSGKWFVVDRGSAFKAVLTEQERLHRGDGDRFDNREKFAMWGKLYGAGGIVTASSQCVSKPRFIGKGYLHCIQNLAIVDAVTGEVVASAEGESDDGETLRGYIKMAASWNDTVDKLNSAFPKNFEFTKHDERMETFKAEAREEAIRQQESLTKKEIR